MPAQEAATSSRPGVWGALRTVVPRWAQAKPPSGKAERSSVAVAATAGGAVLDPPAAGLERTSFNLATQEQQKQSDAAPTDPSCPDFGYARGLDKKFRVLRELGRGGNGVVRVVEELATGAEFALKSIPKQLTDPKLSEGKKKGHVEALKREVEVLRRLRGCLNVAALEEVYEDDTHVHMVLEYCRGGELHHHIGETHYSERTVASYMRAVLRTLAQCHSQGILHRDIKPGNFLLASDALNARLKAIDFGLAVFFEEDKLPRTDLGLEGTPWFMSPESLRSEVCPASDVWAAGVMAHQLLTGRFPFDDKSNPFAPSLSKVWRSILADELDFTRSHWEGISAEAKDFIRCLLNKDHSKRPTALQALQHPWLQGPGASERGAGKRLAMGVVQRIQRYSQGSVFKRSVLDMIAEELMRQGPEEERAVPIGRGATPIITDPQSSPLEYLYEHLSMTDKALVDREEIADGLEELGYRLTPEELERLLDQLDPGNTGKVAKAQVAASQIDWRVMQQSQTERWLKCVRSAFQDLDTDGDGIISSGEMVAMLRNKLPQAEVEAAVRHALQEAARRSEGSLHRRNGHEAGDSVHSNGSAGDSVRDGMSFRQFVRMLRAGSTDCLDLYDDRHGSYGSYGSHGSLSMLDKSVRGSTHAAVELLDPIKELP
ncbi:Pkinase-domain-containing [Micractinium conductrix]|uniref:Pkinase-domain-containing n=1 Tax=Micractinium conductrix TaxID=554055 RepID=A0A2P6VGL8_9CHLO|nr:Pkinase-domain-containing [Micractinium conductrix]|eukprot:PSC73235.1 Pkinase-domain-containing [Micractinium conductrix]